MQRARVVVAGMGDTGILTAIHLSRHVDVVGVATKPGLVSGQELGLRLARPDRWARDYRIAFDRFRGLDPARIVHGAVTTLDTTSRRIVVRTADGGTTTETYDAIVIATGVANGFWRRPAVETETDVDGSLTRPHHHLLAATRVVVVGGGAAAVSTAAQVAARWPEKQVALHFPGDRGLPRHHARTWSHVRRRLARLGVELHPGHRAEVPGDFTGDAITSDAVRWTSGQPPTPADATVWAIGRVRPNTGWLPDELLDDAGFVRVGRDLRVPGHDNLFAVGDVAATDPLRTSARNQGHRLAARNVRAHLTGRPLASYRPRERRWGSVLGPQPDGLEVFAPDGRPFRVPAWAVDTVLLPWAVRRGIYRGVRPGR